MPEIPRKDTYELRTALPPSVVTWRRHLAHKASSPGARSVVTWRTKRRHLARKARRLPVSMPRQPMVQHSALTS